jgi:hypothetical protein
MSEDYFQHVANKGRARKDIALDVVEFEPVEVPGAIEVREHVEDTGVFRKLFAELMGKRP